MRKSPSTHAVAFVAFTSACVSYIAFIPADEPAVIRGLMAVLTATMACVSLLLAIRSIIREELERKELP